MFELAPGIIAGLGAAIGFGVGDFFAARALDAFNKWHVIFWSQLLRLNGVILAFIFLEWDLRLTLSGVTLAIISTLIFLLGLSFTLKAFKIGPVSLASPFVGTYALVATALSLALLNERLRSVQLIAVLLLVFGAMLASVSTITNRPQKNFWLMPTVYLALTGAACIGVAVFFLALLVHEAGWQSALLFQTIILVIGAGVAMRATNLPLIPPDRFPINMAIVGSAIFGTIGGIMLSSGFSSSLVAIVAPVASTSPLITVALSLYFFKEKLSVYQLSGGLVIIFGLTLLSIR